MASLVPSQAEIYEIFKGEVQTIAPDLTDFEEGSINDVLAGSISVVSDEILKLVIAKFNKTFFSTAHGSAVTGDVDDLEHLAKDHFGESFARPGAQKAVGVVTFDRPNTDAGNVTILAGSVVKTKKDANGEEQRFTTLADVLMTGLSINASVEAVTAGSDGNVDPGEINKIETSLTDTSITVTNAAKFSGGAEAQTDAEYREFIRRKVEIIRGATKAAIEAAAENVSGIELASALESLQTVKEWDVGGDVPVGEVFSIPRVKLYVADANGTASDALIDLVEAAILPVRACGVRIEVIGATALPMDWTGTPSLNPAGPNFAEFSNDLTRIVESMSQYIIDLDIGEDFNRALAKQAIMAIWGPSGTNDITDFVTSIPTATIDVTAPTKLIPGTVETV